MELARPGNAWQQLVFRLAGEDKHDFVVLAFGWKKIVGKLLAERTSLQKVDNQVLFVSVTNNVWMQELVLRKAQILEDIAKILKIKLADVVFFIGKEDRKIRI
ncbi:MAG TPA: DUF721 domain-containing protein [Candidatus Cloacimonadota bacterium]|nr:DUF721 domain-containing protein [Candidatus Cloacimonadota bacterium]